MIKRITIFTPEPSYLEVGQNIVRDKKETKIKVTKIKVRFGKIKVYFSSGEVSTYRGFSCITS